MMRRIWRAYTVEWMKAWRVPGTYAGPFLVVAAVIGMAISHALRNDPIGYPFIALGTTSLTGLPTLLLVFIFGATSMSTELATKTARTVLFRPIRRTEFLVAKWLFVFTYGVILVVLVAASVWIAAAMSSNLAGLVVGGEVVYTGTEMRRAYLLGLAVMPFVLAAAAAYSVTISVLIPNPGGATAVAIAGWLLIDLVKYPLHLEDIFFWTHSGQAWERFNDLCNGLPPEPLRDYALCIAVCTLTTGLAGVIAISALRKRNL